MKLGSFEGLLKIPRYGAPEIFNTDQGAQFTSMEFTHLLKSHSVRISMDGRGRVQDNIFIERLRWTFKYQYLYLWSFNKVPSYGGALDNGLSSTMLSVPNPLELLTFR